MNPFISSELAALHLEDVSRPEHSDAKVRGHRPPRLATIFRSSRRPGENR